MRQRAEILAGLFHDAGLLILDEPTTVLTPAEATQLFAVLADLTERGTTVVLVTHKLREVLAVTENVSVLRGGRLVAEAPTARASTRSASSSSWSAATCPCRSATPGRRCRRSARTTPRSSPSTT